MNIDKHNHKCYYGTVNLNKKTNMAEENPQNDQSVADLTTFDDVSVMRVLLHNIKGISSVSSISSTAMYDYDEDELTA